MNSGPLLFLGLFAAMGLFVARLHHGAAIANWQPAADEHGGRRRGHVANVSALLPPAIAHQGAEVYKANGCSACHTQFVRPASLGPDISNNWGVRRSVAQDYLFADPVLLGSQRIGPDLANVGRRTDMTAILMRLYNPAERRRKVSHAQLQSSCLKPRRLRVCHRQRPSLSQKVSARQPDLKSLPKPEARALAAYLLNLRQDGYLFEAPPPPQPKTNSVPAPASVKK